MFLVVIQKILDIFIVMPLQNFLRCTNRLKSKGKNMDYREHEEVLPWRSMLLINRPFKSICVRCSYLCNNRFNYFRQNCWQQAALICTKNLFSATQNDVAITFSVERKTFLANVLFLLWTWLLAFWDKMINNFIRSFS